MRKYRTSGEAGAKRVTIKELPEEERPRERLMAKGCEALSTAELLAIIIRDGTRKESALDLARRLLYNHDGSLRDIALHSPKELKIPGLGPARTAQVLAALALARRLDEQTLPIGQRFISSRQVFDHFHQRLRYEKRECFYALLLDVKNRILKEAEISAGGLSSALVNPRDVLKAAMAEQASAMIVVHNHPSGDPEPSADDVRMTRQLKEACAVTGIRFLDHVIIGEHGFTSLADTGKV